MLLYNDAHSSTETVAAFTAVAVGPAGEVIGVSGSLWYDVRSVFVSLNSGGAQDRATHSIFTSLALSTEIV